MPCLFDTSVWVALFLDNDVNHTEALRIWEELQTQVLLAYIVAAEAASVLVYKHSKEQADKFLQFISESSKVIPYQNQFLPETDFFLRFSRRLSFADYAVLHIARTFGYPLITFDRQMRSALRAMDSA